MTASEGGDGESDVEEAREEAQRREKDARRQAVENRDPLNVDGF